MQRLIFLSCSFFFAGILFSTTSFAQPLPANIHFTKYTIDNGLCDNRVNFILKDKKGFVWIATHDGLSRFDGVSFKNFRHDVQDSNSICNNFIYNLALDSSGRIWCSTYNGLSVYNPNTGKFWNFIPPEKDFVKSRVLRVCIAHDGACWFSTWNRLNKLDLKSMQITSYLIDSAAADKNNASAAGVFEDNWGNFWFDSYKGIFIFNLKTQKISQLSKYFGLGAFYTDEKENTWYGGWESGLKQFNANTKKIGEFYFHNPAFSNDDTMRVLNWASNFQQPGFKNYLWVSSQKELAVFDMKQQNFVHYYQFDPLQNNSFPRFLGQTMCDNNNFWISADDGLYTAKLNEFAVTDYNLSNNFLGFISCVRVDRNNKNILWTSLYGGGIYKIERSSGKIIRHVLFSKEKNYSDSNLNYVSDFIQTAEGNILFTSPNSLAFYNPASGEKKHFYPASQKNLSGSESYSFQEIIPQSDTSCWLSTSIGLADFNYRTKQFHFYLHYTPSISENANDHYVRLIKKDREGNIWLYSHNEGFFVFLIHGKKFRKINLPTTQVIDLNTRGIAQTADGTIWISADDRLFFKPANDTAFHQLTSTLITGFIYNLEATGNDLYIQISSGILQYHVILKSFLFLNNSNSRFTNSNYGFDTASGGNIFIKLAGNFIEIDTNKILRSTASSPLVFENMSINGKDSFINFDFYKSTSMHLNYWQNQLAFQFRLLNFDGGLTNYFYRLSGWDKDWIAAGTVNYVSYSNLPGGEYILHVKAVNAAGSENTEQAEIHIHIATAFWKTWWFYGLCIAAFLALIYFMYTLRLERKLVVEQLRTKISKDLHDDVGSTLTSINIWSDVAERQITGKENQSAEYLRRIKTSSQNMLDNMNDIIWAINSENDTLEKVLIRMKQYASEILEPKNISFHFSVADEIKKLPIQMEYRRELYLIFKEAINNAAKYAEAKNIEVSIFTSKQLLVMSIADDGKGFDKNIAEESKSLSGNGLKNILHRAGQIKAELEINSSPGNGTKIILQKKIT